MARKNWTRDEIMVAFNLYCKLPFSVINAKRKEVIELANLIGRTPSAIAWKLVNFASLDPKLQAKNIKGASNGSKLDKIVFDEFYQNWEKMIYESEIILQHFKNNQPSLANKLNQVESNESDNLIFYEKEGLVVERIVKARVNQKFFRKMILSSYENKCCFTGMEIDALLVASHIIPWAEDEKNRLNPENGLCLNYLHDKAFDKGLITVDFDYRIKISKYLQEFERNPSIQKFFLEYNKKPMTLPNRFLPNKDFLDYHHQYIFKG